MLSDQVLDQDTPEERIAVLVDAVRHSPDRRDALVELLPERLPLYAGRSTNATVRIRGYILATFERVGLPEAALAYVLEELESGRDAYLVAAAAKALRGFDGPASWSLPFLFKAIENVKYVDDALSFESYKPRWPVAEQTTALEEVFRTFAWLGIQARPALSGLEAMYEARDAFSATTRAAIARAIAAIRGSGTDGEAGCCGGGIGLSSAVESFRPASPLAADPVGLGLAGGRARGARGDATVPIDVELEDQDGRTVRYGGFLSQKPSIVAFFYTRCNNPNKCSLTVTKLARLQRAIREAGLRRQLRIAAITYDPAYDLPPRLRAYGENRGVIFDEDNRFLRAQTEFTAIQEYFELGVNFGQALVNRHRIELFVLDNTGHIAATFARLQWDVHDVLDHARALLSPRGGDELQQQSVADGALFDALGVPSKRPATGPRGLEARPGVPG